MSNFYGLLIASSGYVNPTLYGDLGKILTSHIPISGKLAINEVLRKTSNRYDKRYVLLDDKVLSLSSYLKYKYKANVIKGSANLSIDQALWLAITDLRKDVCSLDIIFGDSLSTDLTINSSVISDAIFVCKTLDTTSWRQIERDKSTKELIFKNSFEGEKNKNRITGSFKISDLEIFCATWKNIIENQGIHDSFWRTWEKYDEQKGYSTQIIFDKSWKDIGHLDSYFLARRQLVTTTSRSFNSVHISHDLDKIYKSGEAPKIQSEINWFKEIPDKLKKFTYSLYSTDNDHSYALDYSLVIPLNEMWISENDDDAYWSMFRVRFEELLSSFQETTPNPISKSDLIESKMYIYYEKLLERIETFAENCEIPDLYRKNLVLNNKVMPNISQILEAIKELVNKISRWNYWSVIHGDLCLSNIFYDRRKDQIKLIDPRGSFGKNGIVGDPIYDLIKFSHSVLGHYDYFACDLFILDLNASKKVGMEHIFDLNIYAPIRPLYSRSILRDLLITQIEKYNLTFKEFRLLESTLFLSAAALHTENNRGIALFLRGMQIAESAMK
jgi:hypothetical protein